MLVTWRYRDRNSLVQRFDPRAWIIFYLCFLGSTLMFWDLRYLLFFALLALLSLYFSRIRLSEIKRVLIFIFGFVTAFSILTFLTGRGGMEVYETEHVINTFTLPVTILGWTPRLTITVERIFFAFSQFLRVFGIAVMTIMIPYSLNPAYYGVTFRGLGLPDKFAYAMDLTMRFIPTFARDFQLTMDAQRARGYEIEKLSGGLIEQVRKMAPLIVPVTIHAIIGSEDIIDAMDLRAFGVGPRTWLIQLHYRWRDYLLIAFGVLILVVSVSLSLFGFGKFFVPPSIIENFSSTGPLNIPI
jgi:energy-coupling factor transport system permease protein